MFLANDHAIAFHDTFPVSPGHALVIPRSHVESIFDLPADAQASLWLLAGQVRSLLCGSYGPNGFTIDPSVSRSCGTGWPNLKAEYREAGCNLARSPHCSGGYQRLTVTFSKNNRGMEWSCQRDRGGDLRDATVEVAAGRR